MTITGRRGLGLALGTVLVSGGQVARPGTTWLVMLLALCDRGEPPGAGANHARRTPAFQFAKHLAVILSEPPAEDAVLAPASGVIPVADIAKRITHGHRGR